MPYTGVPCSGKMNPRTGMGTLPGALPACVRVRAWPQRSRLGRADACATRRHTRHLLQKQQRQRAATQELTPASPVNPVYSSHFRSKREFKDLICVSVIFKASAFNTHRCIINSHCQCQRTGFWFPSFHHNLL